MKKTIVLHNAQQAHQALTAVLWPEVKAHLLCGGGKLVVSVKPETRSSAQNNRLWAMLGEIAAQVEWHGRKLSDTEWKHVFSAALKRQDVVPGLDGGFVVLGQSTSKMSVKEMCELQELMTAFGIQHNVKFSAPAWMEDAQ